MRFSMTLLSLLVAGAIAHEQKTPTPATKAELPSQSAVTQKNDGGPVAVPEATPDAMRYYHSGNILWIVDQIWGLLVPACILFTGFSARIRNAARRIGRSWLGTIIVYFILYALLLYLLNWPLDFYQGFIRQHDYGMSNQDFARWLGDSLKGLLVVLVAGGLFLWVPYLLIKKSPDRWWLYTAALAVPFIFFVVLVTPIWIEPLFNNFYEMKNKDLEAKILALARRAGIDEEKVFEVDKSNDTKAVNAYVTGFLGTKRIVLWDTAVAKLDERELLFVMGHEMGHYVLNHIVMGVLFGSMLILAGLYAVHRISAILIRRYQERFGFDRLSDIASLPLLILLGSLLNLVLAPAIMGFSRYVEHEADRFGLEITQDNHAAAMGFVKLQQENLGNPRPGWLVKIWRASHPPLGERVEFSNSYRPWAAGEPLRYGHLFRSQ